MCAMRRAVAALLVLTAVLVSSCSLHHDARIVGIGGDPVGGAGLGDSHPHQPYLDDSIVICLDRPGTATITKVAPIHPWNGLTVDDFAAVPRVVDGDLDTPTGSTIADVTTVPSATVTQKCPHETEGTVEGAQYGYTLFVQYSKPTDDAAWDNGVRVYYRSGGRSYTTDLHFQFGLCTEAATGEPCGA